jgi:hypothetical protein
MNRPKRQPADGYSVAKDELLFWNDLPSEQESIAPGQVLISMMSAVG